VDDPLNQPGSKPAHAGGESNVEVEADKPLPLQLELPPAKVPSEEDGNARVARARPPFSWARVVPRTLAVLATLTTATAAATVWILPGYVRHQCIEIAAANDVELAVDDTRVDWAGFHLVGLRATSAEVPGARAQAPLMDVETSALRPRKMTIHGAELALTGPFGKTLADVAKWRSKAGGGQSEAWRNARWVLEGAHVVWRAPIGEDVRVEARDVTAELQPQEVRARSDDVTVAVPGGTFGPWRIDIERAQGTERVRLALDPGVPEACTVLLVGDYERTKSVDVVVPRSRLAHLGVPGQFLGLDISRVQLDASIHYATLGPSRADASAGGGLYGVTLPIVRRSVDIAWEAALSGDPRAGIDVKKARLAVGPLVGPLKGTLKRFDDGFRIDLAWAAGPVPCEAFAAPLGLGQPFDIGFALRKIADSSRAQHGAHSDATGRKGNVSATVMVSFDSRDLNEAKIDFAPEVGCSG
jgi:hypothetical protein